MKDWLLSEVLRASASLSEEAEGYILGRGLPERLMEEMRVGLWEGALSPSPDSVFNHRNGDRGQYRKNFLSVPMWSPRGKLVGVEFRSWRGEKEIRDFRLPESKYVPCFIGLTPSVLQKIWDGGDVWLVEGAFDLSISHAIPERDVALAAGTARVTRTQVDFFRRFLRPNATVHVAFDMDETGRKHVNGFVSDETGKFVPGVPERLTRVGIRSRPVSFRGGKDPGEIWEWGGAPALREAFKL